MMKILATLEESVNLEKLNGLSKTQLLNAFFANYLGALVLLKLDDLKGLMLVNDRSHSKLTSFSKNMSEINFWARALFCSTAHDVKPRLGSELSAELHDVSKRIALSRLHQIMMAPMLMPDHVDWSEILGSMIMLKHVFNYHSSYFDQITKTLARWDTISVSERGKVVNTAFMFLLQSDQRSKLTSWFRSQSGNVLSRVKSSQRIVKFNRLSEEDGGVATGDGSVSTGNIASNAIVNPDNMQSRGGSDIDLSGLFKLAKKSPNQVTKKSKLNFQNGKIVVKRKKNFNPLKFKAPEFMKAKKAEKTKEKGKENEVE